MIAEKIPPQALVLIETTVAPGTTEQVAYPIIKRSSPSGGSPPSRCWRTATNA